MIWSPRPSIPPAVEAMFTALTDCQALHPDPDESDSDLEGDEYDVEEAGEFVWTVKKQPVD